MPNLPTSKMMLRAEAKLLLNILSHTLAMQSPSAVSTPAPVTLPNPPVVFEQKITTTAPMDLLPKPKTVYLIRHAESLENVAYAGARRVQSSYARRKLPELGDVVDAFKLTFKMFRPSVLDSAVSDLGKTQIQQLHDNLDKDKFLVNDNTRPYLIVHSPLQRAKQTAYGVLFGPDMMDAPEPPSDKQVLALESLREVNPLEIMVDALMFSKKKTVDKRIEEFEKWLDTRDEDAIVVVGHSVYIKRMLNLPETFDNCDLWELEYVPPDDSGFQQDCKVHAPMGSGEEAETSLPRSWKSLRRLYRYTPQTKPELVDEENF